MIRKILKYRVDHRLKYGRNQEKQRNRGFLTHDNRDTILFAYIYIYKTQAKSIFILLLIEAINRSD